MVKIQCPIDNCDYETPDHSDAIVAALLSAHATVHSSGAQRTAKPTNVKLPTISAGGTTEDWSYFTTRWGEYVTATGVSGTSKAAQLLECCDEDLRKNLTRSNGGSLINKEIGDILNCIKKLAIREDNVMLTRVQLYNMKQDMEESVRKFGSRLQSKASTCKYQINCDKCNESIDFTDSILRDILVKGLCDHDIQTKVLSHADQNLSLEDTFKYIETKETGKRTADQLNNVEGPISSTNASSSYKKQERNKIERTPIKKEQKTCTYCGKHGHGTRASAGIRRQKCPAFQHQCKNCSWRGHYDKLCRSNSRSAEIFEDELDETDEENGVILNVNSFTNVKQNHIVRHKKPLLHHRYQRSSNKWIKAASEPPPFVSVDVSVSCKDHENFGYEVRHRTKTATVSAMADTGCQSCLCGIGLLGQLGMKTSDLIPVKTRMNAANKKPINILGAVFVTISAKDQEGALVKTKQLVYITDDTETFFLSKEACQDLKMIPHNFPSINNIYKPGKDLKTPITCSCPKRSKPPLKPTSLPYAATTENIPKLQQFLLDHYNSSTFNVCEHQPLPLMEGPPMKLMISEDAKPVAYHTPLPVPLHWQEQVKHGLDSDVALGVIEPVPVGEPVTWCHRMVVCAKKNGKPRRTVDLQALNKFAIRETHHTQAPFHQARNVPANTYKTVFDAWNGYHSVPICPEDRHLTTFITPWGRYRYCSAPQGYIASGDGYSRRYDEIVAEIPHKTKCIDDTIMWSKTIGDSFYQAAEWLDVCGHNGITLNPDKFRFAQESVEFAGFEISKGNVRPSKKYFEAIEKFPIPKNITDIRSWFGLINQVSYAFSMSKTMQPFRALLKPNTKFEWSEKLNQIFNDSKEFIIREIQNGVQIFDKNLPTCLSTDWSKEGIGFWLSQKHCKCSKTKPFCCRTGWKPTLIGSRFTHAAESRYAPVEGEALALVEGLNRTRYYVLGCKELYIATDHRPLLKIFGDRSLEDLPNVRLRNLKEKSLRYKFALVHVPGVKHKAADAVSRQPSGSRRPEKLHLPDDVANICQTEEDVHEDQWIRSAQIAALNDLKTLTWEKVKDANINDVTMKSLMEAIESGDINRRNFMAPAALKPFMKYKESLYTLDGVILYKQRILVPAALRTAVLDSLHAAHQGVSSMTSRASASVFWPSITQDIAEKRSKCVECNKMAPSQPSAPPFQPTVAEYPFQNICADFFSYKGNNYLVIVDRYSNWPIIEKSDNGSQGLIKTLRQTFATYGIPDELSSDGGPEFTANTTQSFLKNWGVQHRQSSAYFPHSNCRAELGVKTAKRLIANNTTSDGSVNVDQFHRALLQYRNTPDPATKLSPSMCIFGRVIRDFIPVHPGQYKPHSMWKTVLDAREKAMKSRFMKCAEYWGEHTKKLPQLSVGNLVWIQNQVGTRPNKWDKTGIVVEVRQHDQYMVKVDGSGRLTLRNRKFLRKFEPINPGGQRTTKTQARETKERDIPTPFVKLDLPPISDCRPLPDSGEGTLTAPPLRRSTRFRQPPDYFNPSPILSV